MPPDRICLIIPPSVFLLDERVFMTLGILRVAAVLERAGWQVDVLDLSGYANYADLVRDYAAFRSSPFFGITATTAQLPAAIKIACTLRTFVPAGRIILGGPHATLVHAAAKRERKLGKAGRAKAALDHLVESFDVLVAGDGEEAIFLACADNAPRIIDADSRSSPLFLTDERLTELPFPARHLVDIESYRYRIDGAPALSLIAQLGCPFGCGFCAGRLSPMLRHIRMRSAENIVQEMIQLYRETGRRGFMFYDDELNVNKGILELMRQIAEVQQKLGTSWRLRGFVKSELFTDEQAVALRTAGFRQILVGFESGSPRILENIEKRATVEENTRCVAIARRHGLTVKALMSIGHPGESSQTMVETKEWLLRVRPEDFDVTVITPYPGSPYYDEAEALRDGLFVYTHRRSGDRLYQEEIDYRYTADYYKGIPGRYVSHVFTDFLSADDLVRGRDRIEQEVRQTLGIPFNASADAVLYEHSMGQNSLPSRVFHSTTRQ